MPDEMVTIAFDMPLRDVDRFVAIVDKWVSEEVLSDRAYERWRNTEVAIVKAADAVALRREQKP